MTRQHDSTAVWARLAGLVVLVVAGAALAVHFDVASGRGLTGAGALDRPWGALLFAVVYALVTLAPVPKNVLSIAAGLLFGVALGSMIVWSAALAGAVVAFWLGRFLGRDGVQRLAHGHLDRLDDLVDKYGAFAVLGLRLVPVVPFTAINYGSGLTALRFGSYLAATGVGIIPGTVAYVALGAYGTDPGSAPFVVAVIALLGLSALGAFVTWRRRGSGPPTGSSDR